jgi:hypothetical protein
MTWLLEGPWAALPLKICTVSSSRFEPVQMIGFTLIGRGMENRPAPTEKGSRDHVSQSYEKCLSKERSWEQCEELL